MSTDVERPDLRQILRDYLNGQLEEDRKLHLAKRPGLPVYALAGTFDPLNVTPQEADHEILAFHQSRYADAIVNRDISEVTGLVDDLMERHGLSGAETRVELGLGLLSALYDLSKVQMGRISGGLVERIGREAGGAGVSQPQAAPPSVPVDAPQVFTGRRLSELLPRFVEAQRGEEWRGQTERQNMKTYQMFMEVCGDLPVDAYNSKDHVVPFLEVLRRLPATHGKSPKDKELTLEQIIARADKEGAQRLSQKTRNRHKAALGSLFEWLIKRAREREEPNPAHGVRTGSRGGKRSKAAKRQVWEGDKLRALFSGPAHKGSHEFFRARPGPHLIKDAYYWLPLLGLYHGARLGELAQLQVEDVREVQGVWCLDINDLDLKHLKNEQSRRLVPIHPRILALGFLDHAREVALEKGDRVFPELKLGGADDKASYDFTRKFGAYRRGIGVYERWLDFHSLRHTFISKLADKSVPDITIATIAGHAGVTQTAHYVQAKKPSVATRFAAISLAEWDEMPI
ncbi:site-specific integrase [uncultured Parvibaculum sp.]|uniref:site-specific integrase n=1 Tax=uncultured Parvibaculum sp. TaxID=291828 RepID=UPI0030D932F9